MICDDKSVLGFSPPQKTHPKVYTIELQSLVRLICVIIASDKTLISASHVTESYSDKKDC